MRVVGRRRSRPPLRLGAAPSGPPTPLTVGLGYIPSVQFAQFYLADQAGYYAAEGLEVTFQNEIDANLVPKVGQGQVDIGISDGTSVIPAVSQGIPIKLRRHDLRHSSPRSCSARSRQGSRTRPT